MTTLGGGGGEGSNSMLSLLVGRVTNIKVSIHFTILDFSVMFTASGSRRG